jgi:hypothetical protein
VTSNSLAVQDTATGFALSGGISGNIAPLGGAGVPCLLIIDVSRLFNEPDFTEVSVSQQLTGATATAQDGLSITQMEFGLSIAPVHNAPNPGDPVCSSTQQLASVSGSLGFGSTPSTGTCFLSDGTLLFRSELRQRVEILLGSGNSAPAAGSFAINFGNTLFSNAVPVPSSAVPEPSSGALALIGALVAGLGLRFKRQ